MSIDLHDIVMEFSGTRALAGVSVRFQFDEVHGLIGENGAGKSTLVSILAGTQPQTSGTMTLDGEPLRLNSARDALAKGIALVSQEGCLVRSLSGAENILLGDEPTRSGLLQSAALLQRARALLEEWFPGLQIDLAKEAGTLDMADQKIIEIVRALRSNIRLLILDEPTATLQAREKNLLWKIIRSLPEKGVGVVLISHFLSEVKALSDTVTVLRDGAHVATGAADDLS
ncbi:ATP-binding cassette domain-containing protein [Aliiruegeria lutimaris]|uniref:ATP-binding cassette domain-containing protein n=1 Tax=Aliiruegeria lutimaris TaxID=571298 RepID=UPI001BAE9A06|nr:ATP-binding cassette domain-containing protein [Aliiruegeria lutimaris]